LLGQSRLNSITSLQSITKSCKLLAPPDSRASTHQREPCAAQNLPKIYRTETEKPKPFTPKMTLAKSQLIKPQTENLNRSSRQQKMCKTKNQAMA
jgi:hypothetical protein